VILASCRFLLPLRIYAGALGPLFPATSIAIDQDRAYFGAFRSAMLVALLFWPLTSFASRLSA
jgi:hypothetical protein